MIIRSRLLFITILVAFFTSIAPSAYADPPPCAPAHGWRAQHDPYYVGYTGHKWDKDYDIIDGTCNREAIGGVLGGIVGGAVGSTIGNGDSRKVAILIGSVLGAVIGKKIGQDMDNADRGCLGHTLELGTDHKPVSWENPENGLSYTVTPLNGFQSNGMKCRAYDLDIEGDDIQDTKHEKACQIGPGNWKRYQ